MWAAVLALGACTMPLSPTVDHDPATDFARLRTFGWITPEPAAQARAKAPVLVNPLFEQRLRSGIERSLTARGFMPGEPPDFTVGYTVVTRDRLRVTNWGRHSWPYPGWGRGWDRDWPDWGNDVSVSTYLERTVAIDIFDGPTGRPIWHGRIGTSVDPVDPDGAVIDPIVDAILARFPPPPGG